MKKNKARFNRPLIGVEGGGYMLKSRAEMRVSQGRAVIVDGLVRFLPDDKHPGYNATLGHFKWRGKPSGGGPTVMQAKRLIRKPNETKD